MFCEKGVRAPATLLKKETLAQVFSCEFCEIFKNIFFYRTPLVAASGGFRIKNDYDRKFNNTWPNKINI